jgi:predicted nucleic acid-binding protein
MFLFDTNVVSALRKPEREGPAFERWTKMAVAARPFLSVVTVMEIEIGILRLQRRDGTQAESLRRWMDKTVIPGFEGRILDFDTGVARRCAALHVPDPCSERDAMIAATALVHGLTVVTRNTADFLATGVPLFNPWEELA